MEKSRIFTIMKEDLVFFPPALSLLRVLSELGYEVIHIGFYSDDKQRCMLQNMGIRFIETPLYHAEGSFVQKYRDIIRFKRRVKRSLKQEKVSQRDYLWIINPANMIPLSSIIGKYKTILQFYEFARPNVTKSYKIYSPFFNLKDICKKAYKIVHCDQTRAMFFKEVYGLEEIPYVIPNKPIFDDDALANPPADIQERVEIIKKQVEGKKVILYQGIFSPKERRLEEFCDAIHQLPEEYVFLAMGRGGQYFEKLRQQYKEDDRIIMVDFIKPPYHLLVTKLAHIGVLTYFPPSSNMASIINMFYCAPNKIFEFGKYGIPMISNNLPGLAYTFLKYNSGLCIKDVKNSKGICSIIKQIDSNYDDYSIGAFRYYESIDLRNCINNVINGYN